MIERTNEWKNEWRVSMNIFSLYFDFSDFLVADTRLYTLSCWLVGRSVHPSHFWIPSGFRITAPAKPSATGLPCIRPCLYNSQSVKQCWREACEKKDLGLYPVVQSASCNKIQISFCAFLRNHTVFPDDIVRRFLSFVLWLSCSICQKKADWNMRENLQMFCVFSTLYSSAA